MNKKLWWMCVVVSVDWYHVLNSVMWQYASDEDEAYELVRERISDYQDVAYIIGGFPTRKTSLVRVPKKYDGIRRY